MGILLMAPQTHRATTTQEMATAAHPTFLLHPLLGLLLCQYPEPSFKRRVQISRVLPNRVGAIVQNLAAPFLAMFLHRLEVPVKPQKEWVQLILLARDWQDSYRTQELMVSMRPYVHFGWKILQVAQLKKSFSA
ncbi:MAG TPA: hypothetical protein PKD12_08980 [Nitrospira sp.]|jgi:hypothetical protein|nr:hypothetical protein [Nitrospira sp.]